MPSQRFHAVSRTASDPSSAWQAMQSVAAWEGIAGVDRVFDAQHDASGHLRSFGIGATIAGAPHTGTATVVESRERSSMSVELVTRDIHARIDVTLRADGDQTAVDVTVAVRSRSFLAGLFFPTVARAIGSGIQDTADSFAARI